MTEKLEDFLVATALAALFLLLFWGWSRMVRGGRPLGGAQRKMLRYGFFFALGMAYAMMVASWFKWPHPVMWAVIAAWGVLLGFVAWRRRLLPGPKAAEGPASSASRPKTYLRAGLPTAALLVCLVGSVVEWALVMGGSGRIWVAGLWTTGTVASVWLGGRDRRIVVITALRAFTALAIIGALAQRTLAGVAVAAAAGALLFTLQKLWKPPGPPVADLEALINTQPSEPRAPGSSHRLQ